MHNFLTTQIESYMGAIFISLLTVFFVSLMFVAKAHFNSDIALINAQQVQVKTISATERVLMRDWIKENNIKMPETVGYRYLYKKYPAKPWLK